ncbi:hypoxanthine-guanine phosphoribosyltransferase [Pseudomarimonas salicorniae]|uniref:Hypoxanthine-guanine phosphoribosyltransferase n=1 Tax=Pseudomarimonas salicorniae TaxID=2933270 RepID=A0ABT0GI49_9GAMM|nr:hypoxanthine-guanine phosphoribosyltransferase [Lysobacter sp. CAU 1642]MCK7594226.1 hypoxanthine-guanine phosphoribosyltransferase [Lysobacter sp. CAU 1642]
MSAPTPLLDDVLADAELVHDRAAIHAATRRMAGELRRDLAGQRPLYLTIMHGGMLFAAELALELGFDVEFDYLHATRYRGDTRGGGLHWLRRPERDMQGRPVILVDDILDEGPTIVAVRDWCREQGADSVHIAVMCWKRHDRGVAGLAPDYWGLEVPDRYVFGYGMDFHEQGRNLPAIYALP